MLALCAEWSIVLMLASSSSTPKHLKCLGAPKVQRDESKYANAQKQCTPETEVLSPDH
jgi:hypothetical protein